MSLSLAGGLEMRNAQAFLCIECKKPHTEEAVYSCKEEQSGKKSWRTSAKLCMRSRWWKEWSPELTCGGSVLPVVFLAAFSLERWNTACNQERDLSWWVIV